MKEYKGWGNITAYSTFTNTQRDHEQHHTRKGAVAGAADGNHPDHRQGGSDAGPVRDRSRIIEQTTVRLGLALGLESVEMAISSAIVLTSLYQGSCVTTTRRVREHGINMQVVCEIQRICIMAEKALIGARGRCVSGSTA